MPILQDLDYIDIWDAFGGQSGDLFIYDNVGRLYAYVCSNADLCNHAIPGNTIAVQSGFDYVLELAKDAAKSDGLVRCKRFIEGDSDDLPEDYATTWSANSLDKAVVNNGPEEDDDWVDGKSKSAQAAEQAAGTANIGNEHPSDYDRSKKGKSKDDSGTTEGEYTGNPSDGVHTMTQRLQKEDTSGMMTMLQRRARVRVIVKRSGEQDRGCNHRQSTRL